MARKKTTKELALYINVIEKALFKNQELVDILISGREGKSPAQIRKEFKEHVKTHLFIDETIEKVWDYIFFDIYVPRIRSNIKYPHIKLVVISHRDTLDDYESPLDDDGDPVYPGNRCKAILQMIEDSLLNDEEVSQKIGIGELDFSNIGLYNGNHYYGYILDFDVSEFR